MTLPAGTIIDKYTLGRSIGSGGMGDVYEAHHTLVGKHCAIKLLKPEMAAQQDVVTRMLREAQAAAAIGHPNIVDTMDFGATPDGSYYLVMEYLDGESFGSLIERTGAMPVEPAVRITLQVLSALEAAHAKGIVHRDLKPDNIFISRGRRGEEEVKLLDFGISKFASANEDAMRLTASGMVLGTPYYMSPEQSDGAAHVDGRTDLWAMGVILYEALSGTIPFPGNTYSQVIIQVATREPPPLRSLRPDVSNALEMVVKGALAKDPDARWHSAADMIRVLHTACPELAVEPDTLAQSSPSLLSTGPVTALPGPTTVPSPPTDPNLATGETTVADQTPAPLPTPITGVEPTATIDVVAPPVDEAPYTQADPVPTVEPAAEPAPRPNQTVSSGAVAGRESVLWDPGARKRKVLVGLGVVAGLVAVGLVLFFALGRKDPSRDKNAGTSHSGQTQTDVAVDAAAAAAMTPDPMRPAVVTPGRVATLSVTLEGLPRRATIKLDGKAASSPLTLPADGRDHALEVSAPRHHTLRQKLVAKAGLSTLKLKMRRRRGRDPVMRPEPRPARPEPRVMRPAPRPMTRDTNLANPYRTPPRRRPAMPPPMRRGGVYTVPY